MSRFCPLLLLLLWLLPGAVSAQVPAVRGDSLAPLPARPLPNGGLTTTQQVNRVRAQLHDALLKKQVGRIPALLDFLARRVPATVFTVRPDEAWALLATTGQFDLLLRRVAAATSVQEAAPPPRRSAGIRDTLLEEANFYLATHADTLTAQTRPLADEPGSFVRLLLDMLPRGGTSPLDDADITRFFKLYPSSPYSYVLTELRRQERERARLRTSMEPPPESIRAGPHTIDIWKDREPEVYHSLRFRLDGCLGGGLGLFTGQLGDNFRLRYSPFSYQPAFALNQFVLGFNLSGSEVKVFRDYTYDGSTCLAGNNMEYLQLELMGGYRFFSGQRLSLTPFIGGGASNLSFIERRLYSGALVEKGVRAEFQRALVVACVLDIRLNKEEKQLNWILKIRAGVRGASLAQHPELSGQVLDLGVGIGFRLTSGLEMPSYIN